MTEPVGRLQPVLGGRVGAPNDSRISVLEATKHANDVDGTARIRFFELV
jgi:hypothetical protein